ncbi:hypothetical protein BDV98DRAFT_609340 [Pterulicium gracile]|uniref:Uncharacterized protein n=1 Tax=Pterulicium gracile TaxID=1884261 RepID=A0A5C3QYP4_9AGAR|nr:hypothetical protein BDV98DRAFT_609340 [Pterula gracilis]
MPKLKLKRTPEEEAAHLHRKAKKRKLSPQRPTSYAAEPDNQSDESEYGPQPYVSTSTSSHYASTSSLHIDHDSIRAEVEDARFRDKLSMALEDDGLYGGGAFDRLDSLESRFNEYVHVPDRYRTTSRSKHQSRNVYDDDFPDREKLDPSYLDDEGYAEYIRMGMYRKTHVREYEEQERVKQARAERKAQDKARKAETKKLELEAEEKRKRREAEKDALKWASAKRAYDERWKELMLSAPTTTKDELRYADVPWPVPPSLDRDSFTEDDIRRFVLMPVPGEEMGEKERKERLRETMLRFHPDKFEGRIMVRVREKDRERVQEAMGLVVRTVSKLMAGS